MDLFTLDDSLRRTEIIDVYESLIWTDRYAEYGDFELVIRSDRGTRTLLPVGTRVAIAKSTRTMIVETVENTEDNNGVETLKINGRSMEIVMDDRTNRNGFNSPPGTATAVWTPTGTPGALARLVFDTICRTNTIIPEDNIPGLVAGSMYPAGTIPEDSTVITLRIDVDTVYNTVKAICDAYHLGFRLTRNGDTGQLYFDVYTGDDRTTLQTVFPAVVFAKELDNLTSTTELMSSAALKTVAYVFAPNGSRIVYADGWDAGSAVGFNRRILQVVADDIDIVAGTPLQDALQQRGKQELAKWKNVIAFDGEIPQTGSYVYGVDYDLGDLVETRNSDGLATNMRVEEQIFVSDATGEKSYPTFVTELLITPGSWYAWSSSEVWADADGTWSEA